MADKYQCSLDKASILKAREELHEIPEERLGALHTFKDWIQQQPWLKPPTDSSFLTNFLRAKKFSQLEARGLLERYWVRRNKYADWCKGIDPFSEPEDPTRLVITRCAFLSEFYSLSFVPLPVRDKNGSKVMMTRYDWIDTSGKSYSFDQLMRVVVLILDTLRRDENVQVNRFVFIMDYTGATIKLQSWMGLDNIRSHWTIIKIHGQSMVSVYEQIDMSLLPVEYLPDDYKESSAGSVKYIVAFLRDLYNGPYGVDILQKPKDDEPLASFRKLNVD
ncbi:hypothetical protein ACJMK2_010535 [Sinanodonta woodiana]|uniref:CRAL-TRIO domain-containing protein n=1 Tax=Sinanodonta woodiana TaxID=1069815 RepID=A0ABD3VGY7_SINWO